LTSELAGLYDFIPDAVWRAQGMRDRLKRRVDELDLAVESEVETRDIDVCPT
jgi:hypothetical protein